MPITIRLYNDRDVDAGAADTQAYREEFRTDSYLQFIANQSYFEGNAFYDLPVSGQGGYSIDLGGHEGPTRLQGDTFGDLFNGGLGEDEMSGLDGDDNLRGFNGNDILIGGNGADSLFGGNGDDTIFTGNDFGEDSAAADDVLAGAGNDRVIVSNTGAQVDGGADVDTIELFRLSEGVSVELQSGLVSNGIATLLTATAFENVVGTHFGDVITGQGDENRLSGNRGDDFLYGEGGDDVLIGGGGKDFLDGGDGFDEADYGASLRGVRVDLSLGTATGGDASRDTLASIEAVSGSDYNDVLEAYGAADIGPRSTGWIQAGGHDLKVAAPLGGDVPTQRARLFGNIGDDVLITHGADDFLDGGADDDLIVIDYTDTLDRVVSKIIRGGDGFDTVDFTRYANSAQSGIAVDLLTGTASSLGVTAFSFVITGIESVIGTGADDQLTGTDADETFYGGDGDDVLSGGGGNDLIVGGAGADEMDGGTGRDTLSYETATTGVEVRLDDGAVYVGDRGDVSDSFTNFENLTGSAFADSLTGDSAANVLSGLEGDDILSGELGNDVLIGGTGSDQLYGGAGRDRLRGGDGDSLYGGDDNDTFLLAGAATVVAGGSGNDRIIVDEDTEVVLQQGQQVSGIEAVLVRNGGTFTDNLETDGGYAFRRRIVSASEAEGGVTINASDAADRIVLGGGFDRLNAFAGDDEIFVSHSNLSIAAGGGTDTLVLLYEKTYDQSFAFTNSQERSFSGIEKIVLRSFVSASFAGIGSQDGISFMVSAGAGARRTFLEASGGDDVIYAKGISTVIGGNGADTIFDRGGGNQFVYRGIDEMIAGGRPDQIMDFNTHAGPRSLIDVSAIDAGREEGTQAFRFVGTEAFSGDGVTGEIRVVEEDGRSVVQFDMNADGEMDALLLVVGAPLSSADFILTPVPEV